MAIENLSKAAVIIIGNDRPDYKALRNRRSTPEARRPLPLESRRGIAGPPISPISVSFLQQPHAELQLVNVSLQLQQFPLGYFHRLCGIQQFGNFQPARATSTSACRRSSSDLLTAPGTRALAC